MRTKPECSLSVRRCTGRHHQVASAAIDRTGFDSSLLNARRAVRERFGKPSDVIHAPVIAVAIPELVEHGHTIVKLPSWVSDNDPNRQFDLDIDRRAAQFQHSCWRGADATLRSAQV